MAMGLESLPGDVMKTFSLEFANHRGMLRATRVKECSHVVATVRTAKTWQTAYVLGRSSNRTVQRRVRGNAGSPISAS
jgi:hypothetical protein